MSAWNGGSLSRWWGAISRTLAVLPDVASTDMHFVADDWAGTGNWTDRVGSWVATVNGAPSRSNSAVFDTRHVIGGWSSAKYFRLAANAAHTIQLTDKISYEFVFDNIPTPATDSVWFGGLTNTPTWSGLQLDAATALFELYIPRTTGNNFWLGGDTATLPVTPNKPGLITITIDAVAPALRLYVNGVQIVSGTIPVTSTVGLLVPVNTSIGIGCRLFNDGPGLPIASTMNLMEIVRSRVVFDASTVAARCAQFNALRGS